MLFTTIISLLFNTHKVLNIFPYFIHKQSISMTKPNGSFASYKTNNHNPDNKPIIPQDDIEPKSLQHYQSIYTLPTLPKEYDFNAWLVGFVDGDGSFLVSLRKSPNNVTGNRGFVFRVTQGIYNVKVLLFIAVHLKCGIIEVHNKNTGVLVYELERIELIKGCIIPIFDQYPLHTVKYYAYNLFKSMLYCNSNQYDTLLPYKQAFNEMPLDYKSPFTILPSKSWIVGFIEAEGGFFIVRRYNRNDKCEHIFAISQKLDKQVLEQIRIVLGINANVTYESTTNTWKLKTQKNSEIEFLIAYFDNWLVGEKRVEFELWAYSYKNYKNNTPKLCEYQELIRVQRSKHKVRIRYTSSSLYYHTPSNLPRR